MGRCFLQPTRLVTERGAGYGVVCANTAVASQEFGPATVVGSGAHCGRGAGLVRLAAAGRYQGGVVSPDIRAGHMGAGFYRSPDVGPWRDTLRRRGSVARPVAVGPARGSRSWSDSCKRGASSPHQAIWLRSSAIAPAQMAIRVSLGRLGDPGGRICAFLPLRPCALWHRGGRIQVVYQDRSRCVGGHRLL